MPGPAEALLVSAGLALPVGFTTVDEDAHCRYRVAEHGEGSWPTLRAECLWESVEPTTLERLLGDWGSYADLFSTVARSTVVGRLGRGTAVHHVHTAPLMVDREATLLFWDEPVGTGRAFRWTLAPGQPAPERGRVQLAQDTGHWTVAPSPTGRGSLLISELTYDPGGRVPDSLVVWFQQLGVPVFVEELRVAATP